MHAEHILKNHDLRVTEARKKVVEHFSIRNRAMSHAELEEYFGDQLDRVTIYRTLTAFLDKGILHKIPNDSGAAMYALCHDSCTSEQHLDDHVHFKCIRCGNLNCLHDLAIPSMELPANYEVKRAVLVYEGICGNCK